MRLTTWIPALLMSALMLCLIAIPAQGGSCAVVVRKPAVVVKDVVVVKEVVQAVVAPVVATYTPIVVPLYSAVYQAQPYGYGAAPPGYGHAPGPGAYPGAAPAGQHNEVLEAIRRISERLDRLERLPEARPQPQQRPEPMPPSGEPQAKAPPPAAPPGGKSTFEQLAFNKCAGCHNSAKPSGGFVMFREDRLVQLTPEQLGDVIDSVTSRRMPKGLLLKMSAEDRLAFVQSMVTRK